MENVEKKICTCCQGEKPLKLFHKNKSKKDGHDYICKFCKKIKRRLRTKNNKEKTKLKRKLQYIKNKEKHKIYRENNKDIIKEKDKIRKELNKNVISEKKKENYKKNSYKIKQYQKEYYKKNKNKVINRQKAYMESHKEERNIRHKIRIKEDFLYKLKCNIRGLIKIAIKSKNFKKNTKTEQILGCSFCFFKQYIENQFNEWQNWNNWGIFKKNEIAQTNRYWSIDHIIPLSSATKEEDVIRLNHYTNLQVLDSYINQYIKKNKLLK